ncbi:MAG: hypothetical protein RL318_1636 [Fibrobacterota bacterium]|jgi:hypothetical protein
MRRIVFLAALVFVCAAPSMAGKLISSGGDVELYDNEKRSGTPASTGGSSEVFVEVKRKGGSVLVRNKSNKEFWADATKLSAYSEKSGQSMDLGSGKIDGYLDNPNTLYIMQEDNNGLGGISLERGFVDAIQGNMDRETVEYRNGENN